MNLKDYQVKSQLEDLLWENREVFRPELVGDETFIGRNYAIPILHREQVQKQIDNMLFSKII